VNEPALALDAATQPAPAPATRPSTKDRIAAAKLPEKQVPICLRTDLQEEYEDLERQLAEATANAAIDPRLNSGGHTRRIAEQVAELEQRMQDDILWLHMRALPRRKWDALIKAHPKREDEAEDELLGFNPETFFPAAIRACTYEPDDLDDETWMLLFDEKLTAGQFRDLHNAVLALNIRKVSVPNSSAASRILRGSAPE